MLDTEINWRPAASLEALKQRARILRCIRAFFERRQVLEVETPILSAAAATDFHLHSFTTRYRDGGRDRPLYLHTSPEYPMKRLLAAGCGSIFQICKVFRNGESGRRHNPEFTLLEWYRVGYDYRQLMDEVAALIYFVLDGVMALAQAPERLSYRQAFEQYAGIDPFTADAAAFSACARAHQLTPPAGLVADNGDAWRDFLLTHVVEPQLGRERLSILHDYPPSQAALARIRAEEPPVAERFEVYLSGMELANGFQELTDAQAMRERFQQDNARRKKHGLPPLPVDERLLAACAQGLPECAGVALGVDRLLMLATGASAIDDVLAFPIERA